MDTCADALIRNADLALYSAKAAGRGTFCFFAPEMHSEAQDRQILENDLRKAIGRGELQLVYQPVVNAQSEQIVRLRGPGALAPSQPRRRSRPACSSRSPRKAA